MEFAYFEDGIGESALLTESTPPELLQAYLETIPEARPPPYTEENYQKQQHVQNSRPGGISGAQVYPSQPYHAQATSRTLHVYYENWTASLVRIMDTDNVTKLFKAKCQLTKPHLSIASAQTAATVGTAVYHILSSRIDTTVRGFQICMRPCATLGRRSYVYSSPTRRGANTRWSSQGDNLDLVCLDERGVPLARFRASNWSMRKWGTLELIGPIANDGGPVMEEIVVTGLAMAEYLLAMRLTGGLAEA
ncbi:MAG: hypothetical protein M1833_000466 [Piccolia ochrophora]|nr:MAG: hypothetical protein M1833_000466 [Piccolia ochrophora]